MLSRNPLKIRASLGLRRFHLLDLKSRNPLKIRASLGLHYVYTDRRRNQSQSLKDQGKSRTKAAAVRRHDKVAIP